jgi:acylphosphatase
MRTIWKVRFEGRVQGVGFRSMVHDLARGFDVCGWVKNLPDGAVELLAAGEGGELAGFVREIVEESPLASHIRSHGIDKRATDTVDSGFRMIR